VIGVAVSWSFGACDVISRSAAVRPSVRCDAARRDASRRASGSRVRAHAVVYAIVPARFRAGAPLSRASSSHNRESNVPVRVSFPHRDVARDLVQARRRLHAARFSPEPSRRLTSRRIASCVRPSALLSPPFSLSLSLSWMWIVDDVVVVAIRCPCYGQTTIRTEDGRGGKSPPGEFEEAQATRNARNFALKKHEIARMSSACDPVARRLRDEKMKTVAGSVAGIFCVLMFEVNAKADTFPLLLVRVNSGNLASHDSTLHNLHEL